MHGNSEVCRGNCWFCEWRFLEYFHDFEGVILRAQFQNAGDLRPSAYVRTKKSSFGLRELSYRIKRIATLRVFGEVSELSRVSFRMGSHRGVRAQGFPGCL